MSDNDEQDDAPERAYDIGYCKPPKEYRFKPGHKLSKGRPRGSRNTKALLVEEWHRLRPGLVNGKRRRVSRSQKGASHVTGKAAEGDLRALEILMKAEADLAEKAAARETASQFTEPADDLAMGDIVRRLRTLPLVEEVQSPRSEDQKNEAAPSDADECGPAGNVIEN